ncbi:MULTISPECIES: hypothetical protein [unclassified Caballeronia]|uniref:hypothetical protein n=1 Tax=unclassified Caballeronia TaxID=2646786 RepID=UPI0020294D33|nr:MULTISPECIES: hypothetical protein [unclassified Caballeronia]
MSLGLCFVPPSVRVTASLTALTIAVLAACGGGSIPPIPTPSIAASQMVTFLPRLESAAGFAYWRPESRGIAFTNAVRHNIGYPTVIPVDTV